MKYNDMAGEIKRFAAPWRSSFFQKKKKDTIYSASSAEEVQQLNILDLFLKTLE